jgi:16S rRNA (uracil1498-N3)-methyltransferase
MLLRYRPSLKQGPILPHRAPKGPAATRLCVPQPLAQGTVVALDARQAHRLQHVLRLGRGSLIAAFNQRDGEWLGRLEEIGRHGASLSIGEQRRAPQCEGDVWLLFAPIRRSRLDWLIEKATELGASRLVPVLTTRTQPERLGDERLRSVSVAAAEQCERLSVPELEPARSLREALDRWPIGRRLIVCDESGSGQPIAAALSGFAAGDPAAILVGPEGGFTETELDAFGKLPIVTRVGLGPRVLRAETAALAALAVFQALAGDGQRARPC